MSQETQETVTIEYKGYKAAVKWSDEDGMFVGKVVDIKDSVSFMSHSIPEAHKELGEVIEFYLETWKKHGLKPCYPKHQDTPLF